jgi:hypothetical protein
LGDVCLKSASDIAFGLLLLLQFMWCYVHQRCCFFTGSWNDA